MYLHLGGDTVVREEDIIGIFDMDQATVSYKTRDFLAAAEKSGRVEIVSPDLPKTFVVCRENDDYRIYICQLAPVTLIKRSGKRFGGNL